MMINSPNEAWVPPMQGYTVPRERSIALYRPSRQAANAAQTSQAYAAGIGAVMMGRPHARSFVENQAARRAAMAAEAAAMGA